MSYKAPHFGNLSKRAKALGMKVTRVTTDEDARIYGGHEYALTQADASQERLDNASCYSLNGIRAEIESLEEINGKTEEAPTTTEEAVARSEFEYSASPVAKAYKRASDDYRHVSREEIIAATSKLSSAKTVRSAAVIGVMEKDCYADNMDEIKDYQKRSMIHSMADVAKTEVEFSEEERVAERGFSLNHATDTHIIGKLVVMKESDYLSVMATMRKLTR